MLAQLQVALEPTGAETPRLVLVDLSNQFYTLLPSLNPEVLDSADKVRKKAEMVDSLKEVQIATSLPGRDA